MSTHTYTFAGHKGRATHTFTCPNCGKPNRTRTFTQEHTVNPFNKNPDGSVKTSLEVMRSAKAAAVKERDQFAKAPLCSTCENGLPYADLKAIRELRRSEAPTGRNE
jgi:hypothetical protein